jgi:hypothetical protein
LIAWPIATQSSMYPSGLAFAVSSLAMMPLAPGRLSTIFDCPHALAICAATTRAMMSVVPPGANGTSIRIGRLGQLPARCWPCRADGNSRIGEPTAARRAGADGSRQDARSRACQVDLHQGTVLAPPIK